MAPFQCPTLARPARDFQRDQGLMPVWLRPTAAPRAARLANLLVAGRCARMRVLNEDLMIAIRALDAKRPGLRQLYGRRHWVRGFDLQTSNTGPHPTATIAHRQA